MYTRDLGQLFIVGFRGTELPEQVKKIFRRGIGGAILFKHNIESASQVVALNQSLKNVCNIPPILSVDQEGGCVARLRDICTPIPPMREVAERNRKEPGYAQHIAELMTKEILELGFNLNFAPVVDIDSNPHNPIIGDRSFSADTHEVAQLGALFIERMQSLGLAACAKHFPGHGDTDVDSHLDLPVIAHAESLLRVRELIPFKHAVDANVASIMTAHVLVNALDAEYPATLSENILKTILRDEMGYQGLIISDDLDMKAVADRYELKEIIRLGLKASVDAFIIGNNIDKAEEALIAFEELVAEKKVSETDISASFQRINSMKRAYCLA